MPDLIVIGAGLSGLALARAAAQRGDEVVMMMTIVERERLGLARHPARHAGERRLRGRRQGGDDPDLSDKPWRQGQRRARGTQHQRAGRGFGGDGNSRPGQRDAPDAVFQPDHPGREAGGDGFHQRHDAAGDAHARRPLRETVRQALRAPGVILIDEASGLRLLMKRQSRRLYRPSDARLNAGPDPGRTEA